LQDDGYDGGGQIGLLLANTCKIKYQIWKYLLLDWQHCDAVRNSCTCVRIKLQLIRFSHSITTSGKMKNRTADLRRLVDKYSIRYGELDPTVMHLKNQLVTLESGQEVIVPQNVKPYPSSRRLLERSKDFERLSS
jgi:hypothetical protein